MDPRDPAAYGEAFADVYDDWYGDISDTGAAVDVLAELTGTGRLLELGVGTGRIAVPLAASGVEVHGIDASPAMLERLRAKPGGELVTAHFGDMAALDDMGGPFRTVFIAFNTFFNLTTDTAQRRCLAHVARLLEPDGHFVVEAFVPATDAGPIDHEEVTERGDDLVRSVSRHDPRAQTVSGVHVQTAPSGEQVERPWQILYRTPRQLDELCHGTGMTLVQRWADWDRRPFGEGSSRHVSLYRGLD